MFTSRATVTRYLVTFCSLMIFFALSQFSLTGSVFAQGPNAGPNAGSDDSEITVRVSTFGRQASFIADSQSLKPTVIEDGRQFAPESTEVETLEQIIVAIDVSDSMKYLLPDMVGHIKKAVEKQPAVPVMIATFGAQVKQLTSFTQSANELQQALGAVRAEKQSTCLYDSLATLIGIAGTRHTHILLVTDGTDTSNRAVNVRKLLKNSHVTISYLNWGYGDASLTVNEPGYQASSKKSKMVERTPNGLLAGIAQASGGDVVNFTSWKPVTQYFQQRFETGSYLYRIFWHTDNPERSFRVVNAEQQQQLLALSRSR